MEVLDSEIIKLGSGSVMRCIFSDTWAFKVRETYKTKKTILCGLASIEINQYIITGHRNGYFSIDGCRTIAKFILVKDSKGRYVKRSRYQDMSKSRNHGKIQDYRRLRRYARQMLKNDAPGSQSWKIIKELSRNAGK